MSQSSLDDDELFGEAASEMRADVEDALDEAWAVLPDPDDLWETDADNVLGVLNGVKSGLDTGDAAVHLKEAKKWFTMGQRADAFEDADDLEAEIERLEDLITDIEDAGEMVGDLTATIPQLKSSLEEAGDEDDEDEE